MNFSCGVNGVYCRVCISGSPSVAVHFIGILGEVRNCNCVTCNKIFNLFILYEVFVLVVDEEGYGVGLGVVSLKNKGVVLVCYNRTEIGSKCLVKNVA